MREFRCRIEIREDSDRRSPGRITGTLLRYGEKGQRQGRDVRCWVAVMAPEGVVLRRQHDRSQPIMRFVPELREGAIVIDAMLPDSEAGRSAGIEIRGRLFTGLSVEFVPSEERHRGGVREIVAAELVGAGLVDEGAYLGSTVSVRNRKRRVWL